MAKMLFKTKGNASPSGKPRMYFTCHPDDFEKCFDKISEDIFKTHDCAVYYTEDMNEKIKKEDLEIDIASNNLVIIPVTYKLLTTPNRAMDEDFPYAIKENIPVLPIMMESGLDKIYERPDRFGEKQYLFPFSNDLTEISYEEKLFKYLTSVLVGDEMAKRIRKAFSSYIFLSYRKKDRRYANELMKIIHEDEKLRDVAVWFDEFLTPGESFKKNIEKILNDSRAFALLVTPNLLEEPGGEPNFVMKEEYPAAKKAGIDILPAEMEDTDKDALKQKFNGIPECVFARDKEFIKRLTDSLFKEAVKPKKDDPEHSFLIGLAYLSGIDVEINRKRGLELITLSAEAGVYDAIVTLFDMYVEGDGAEINYSEAIKWGEKAKEYCIDKFGEEDKRTIDAINNLAHAYSCDGDNRKSLELSKKAYEISIKVNGENSKDTLLMKSNMAQRYGLLGDYDEAFRLKDEIYKTARREFGMKDKFTLIAINNLASTLDKLGEFDLALIKKKRAFRLACEMYGTDNVITIRMRTNLATGHRRVGDYEEEIRLNDENLEIALRELGEEDPVTMKVMSNLAVALGQMNDEEDRKRAFELTERAYNLRMTVLGENHPDTIESLNNLAYACYHRKNRADAVSHIEKARKMAYKVFGARHMTTLEIMNNMAFLYSEMGKGEEAIDLNYTVWKTYKELLGEDNEKTLSAAYVLGVEYRKHSTIKKAVEHFRKLLPLQVRKLGEDHPETRKVREFLLSVKKLYPKL